MDISERNQSADNGDNRFLMLCKVQYGISSGKYCHFGLEIFPAKNDDFS
jgi:hypothetical protein